MKAQQQAVKLVNKHLRIHNGQIAIAQAHAITTAKFIIKEYKKNLAHLFDISMDVKYWKEVIKEIENL